MKRILDFVLSLILILVLLPLFIIITIIVRFDSKGPAIYRQKRVGRYGKIFSILKFRTMVQDADQVGGYSTSINDSRITPLGKYLRKTSLDELPQLVNVFKGEMSLVGPRPDVPEQESNYSNEEWIKRLQVRPGITGLAQATVRSQATPDERKMLDLKYVDNASLYFDIKILLMTVRQLLGKGSF